MIHSPDRRLTSIAIDLGQAIHALSDALDLVGVDEVFHGKRVGFMVTQCGLALGLGAKELGDLFHAALLHDCGVSSTHVHCYLVNELDWEGSEQHCIKGSELLDQFPPLAHLAPLIRYHHSHWDALHRLDISESVARLSNLIYLVDRVDALAKPHYERDLLLARHAIRETVSGLSGSLFAPDLVALFLNVSASEAFWLSLESRHLIRFIYEREEECHPILISFPELRQLALLFAQVVDAKSPYTMRHSLGVAQLARFLAERAGLSSETCAKIEVAGLLHDLGKLQVPDAILEKHGALTLEERAIIQRHSFETYQILRGIAGLEDITLWAAYHHETPDGRGYPFQRRGAELTVEMRIIAVADVFEALAQQRPYRESLPPDEILEMLRAFVREGRLDGVLVELVGRYLQEIWQIALAASALEPGSDPAAQSVA